MTLSSKPAIDNYVKTDLQILLIEDNAADAELIAHELTAGGFSFSLITVETEVAFRRELKGKPDLILSDHGLPAFNGFRALEITRLPEGMETRNAGKAAQIAGLLAERKAALRLDADKLCGKKARP